MAFRKYPSRSRRLLASLCLGSSALISAPVIAQDRTKENVVTAAEDAFGVSVGSERIGLYTDREVRGFSPVTAGNVRLEGIYINVEGGFSNRLVRGSTVRVGLASAGYPFLAPSGVVDYRLRRPSENASLSAAADIGPFGGYGLEIDASVPIVEGQLALSGGASFRRRVPIPGQANRFSNLALVAQWSPAEGVEFLPFVSYNPRHQDVEPTVFVAGAFLPPEIDSASFGQRWADQRRTQIAYGSLVSAQLGERTRLKGGLFRSIGVTRENFSDLFRDTDRDGFGDRFILSNPRQRQASNSGEIRLTHSLSSGRLTQSVHIMGRARRSTNLYGGASSVALGRSRIGVLSSLPEPQFVFGEQSQNLVTQLTAGIGYEALQAGLGELNLGVQRTRYRKDVSRPGIPESSIENAPWLFNGMAAIFLSSQLVMYGSYTRGLEENGVAPSNAVNRDEPLPAALTSQKEFGLRYALTPAVKLVVGVFELEKPYFNLNAANIFTRAGTLRSRGIEFSVAGPLARGLNLVLGGAWMNPLVSGEAVQLGRIGEVPVGLSRRLLKLDVDYSPPFLDAFSIDLSVGYSGSIAASLRTFAETNSQLFAPARTVFDVGARYKFELADHPALIRAQLENLTNVGGWEPTSSGGFRQFEPRSMSINLTIDF